MSDRKRLLSKLNKVADRAAIVAIDRGFPITVSKNITRINEITIEKNNNGLYNIISPTKKVVFEDINVFDVAVIIAQRYNTGETSAIRKVLVLEERFVKHHNDMIHYLDCLKGAKLRHDVERMAILEDKFQVAEQSARAARDNISIFKRIK